MAHPGQICLQPDNHRETEASHSRNGVDGVLEEGRQVEYKQTECVCFSPGMLSGSRVPACIHEHTMT